MTPKQPTVEWPENSLLQRYAGLAGQEGIISLAIGQPADDPPKEVSEAISRAMLHPGYARYTPAGGSNNLLGLVAGHLSNELGFPLFANEVVVSHGAKLLIDVALKVLRRFIGSGLVWFAPGYTYESAGVIEGFEPLAIDTSRSDFLPDLEILKKQIQIACKTHGGAVMIINNPVNPTGRLWPLKLLEEIAVIIRRKNVAVIADETYCGLVHKGFFTAFASLEGMHERTITIRSGSKDMMIPGLRFGYAAGPSGWIDKFRLVLGDCVGCPNTLTQAVAGECLHLRHQWAKSQVEKLRQRRQLIMDWAKECGFPMAAPDGAFYAFVDFSEALKRLRQKNTIELADYFLSNARVGIIPGAAFGGVTNSHQRLYGNWARLSYAGSIQGLGQGLNNIVQSLL